MLYGCVQECESTASWCILNYAPCARRGATSPLFGAGWRDVSPRQFCGASVLCAGRNPGKLIAWGMSLHCTAIDVGMPMTRHNFLSPSLSLSLSLCVLLGACFHRGHEQEMCAQVSSAERLKTLPR